jgi:hypothetical protein
MDIEVTKLFSSRFSSISILNKFIENFKEWKSSSDPDSSFYFGKDAGYREPKLSTGYLLHVHTPPTTKIERDKWSYNFENSKKRTSDRALVYIKRGTSYLLIDWIKSDAHESTDYSIEGKKNLLNFANIAEKFLNDEEITENKLTNF